MLNPQSPSTPPWSLSVPFVLLDPSNNVGMVDTNSVQQLCSANRRPYIYVTNLCHGTDERRVPPSGTNTRTESIGSFVPQSSLDDELVSARRIIPRSVVLSSIVRRRFLGSVFLRHVLFLGLYHHRVGRRQRLIDACLVIRRNGKKCVVAIAPVVDRDDHLVLVVMLDMMSKDVCAKNVLSGSGQTGTAAYPSDPKIQLIRIAKSISYSVTQCSFHTEPLKGAGNLLTRNG